MIIDIYDYFDRWMNNYIVYHTGHLEQYGDIERANIHFSSRFNDLTQTMRDANLENQMSSIQANMRSKSQKARGSLKILNALQKDNLLEQTLNEISEGLNEAMDIAGQNVVFDNYESLLQQAGQFNDLLSKGSPESARINDFFNLLVSALDSAQLVDENILQELSNLGQELTGSNFSINTSNLGKISPLNLKDAQMANKVIDSLAKATQKMNQEGIVNSRSFATTINYIFQKVIGTKISEMMLAEGLKTIVQDTDNVFEQFMKKPMKNGKLTWVDKHSERKNDRLSFSGSIIDNGVFSLKLKKGKEFYDVEIAVDPSIKLYKNLTPNTNIAIIGKSNISNFFSGDMQEKYLAYNVIAHRWSSNTRSYEKNTNFQNSGDLFDAYHKMRAFIAGSFFNDWVKSKGFKTPSGQRAQFLMINGKVYSVMRIISNICNDLVKRGSRGGVNYEILNDSGVEKVKNTWRGTYPNRDLGLLRSSMVNKLIDTLVISFTLNNRLLQKYAY